VSRRICKLFNFSAFRTIVELQLVFIARLTLSSLVDNGINGDFRLLLSKFLPSKWEDSAVQKLSSRPGDKRSACPFASYFAEFLMFKFLNGASSEPTRLPIAANPLDPIKEPAMPAAEPLVIPSAPQQQPAVSEDVVQRALSLCMEHERFSENFVREVGKLGSFLGKLMSDQQGANQRLDALQAEHNVTREHLVATMAKCESLKTENAQLQASVAAHSNRGDRAQSELMAAREHINALQMRNDTLTADYNRTLDDLDRHRNDLLSTRHDLNDIQQKYEQSRIQVEQSRLREAAAESRLRMVAVDAEGNRASAERSTRELNEHLERNLNLTNELQSIRDQMRNLVLERDAIMAERDRLVGETSNLSLKMEESNRKYDAKLDGLSRTKAFLWETCEKQRHQIADQAARIGQLEQSNARLSQLLGDSTSPFQGRNGEFDPEDKSKRLAELQ
jgi:predicted  nucleic acid-binding Zn-ribbon protein